MKPKALVLQAHGTNRDLDAAEALALAGADPEIVPLNALREGSKCWGKYQLLVLPGGFSYADAFGAGKLFAIDMQVYFADQIQNFVETGKPVIGICNGFQALVKSGILLSSRGRWSWSEKEATLTFNSSGHFECRWVTLKPVSQLCIWTRGLADLIACPIAHGEGNFQVFDRSQLLDLQHHDQVALTYVYDNGLPANGSYAVNPNGSLLDIAGITNSRGNVLGLMPHPENHIHPWQHPQWTRGIEWGSGLSLFKNGVKYAEER